MSEARSAQDVSRGLSLSPEAKALLKPEQTDLDYARALTAGRRYIDLVRYLAQFLPESSALWWGCLCVRHTLKDSDVERGALHAVVRYVRQPSEQNRRACRECGQTATPETPAGCLAMAAAAGERGSAHTGRMIAAAVFLSASRSPSMDQAIRQYGIIGLDVHAGKLSWTT